MVFMLSAAISFPASFPSDFCPLFEVPRPERSPLTLSRSLSMKKKKKLQYSNDEVEKYKK